MASLYEFYQDKEKRELFNIINSAKYISEEQRNTMIEILEDADADMKAAREKKDRERKRAAASQQTGAYRGIEKSRPTKDKAPLHPESVTKEDADADMKAAREKKKREADRKKKDLAQHFKDQESGRAYSGGVPTGQAHHYR